MRRTQRSVLRKQGFKLPPLTPVSLRLPTELWEKCGWAAEVVGLSRTEFVRNTLANATKATQRPENAKSRMILASAAEWRNWHAIARYCNVPLDEMIRKAMNRLLPVAKDNGVE